MVDMFDSVVLAVQVAICIVILIMWKHQNVTPAYASSIAAWDTVEHKALSHTHAPVDMSNSLETRIIRREGDPLPAQTLFSLYSREDLRFPSKPKIGKVVLRRDNSIHAYDMDNDPILSYTGPYAQLKAKVFKEWSGPWYVSENDKSMTFKKVRPSYQDIMSGRDLHELPALEVNA